MLLYLCPQYYYIYMFLHTAIYVCPHTDLYICPHTGISVFSDCSYCRIYHLERTSGSAGRGFDSGKVCVCALNLVRVVLYELTP
jgi:hypothetical protein